MLQKQKITTNNFLYPAFKQPWDLGDEGGSITASPSSSLSLPSLRLCGRPRPRPPSLRSLSFSPPPDFTWRTWCSSHVGATACHECAWWTASGGSGRQTRWNACIRPSRAGTGCHGSRETGSPPSWGEKEAKEEGRKTIYITKVAGKDFKVLWEIWKERKLIQGEKTNV